MNLTLHYVEGTHDTVPGIKRFLEHSDTEAEKRVNEIHALGGRSYRTTLSTEVPGAFNYLEMEAALCVWEHLCDITVNTEVPHTGWLTYRQQVGSAELRHMSIAIGKWALEVHDLLPEWYCDGRSYDWEVIPSIVNCLPVGDTSMPVQEAAAELLSASDVWWKYFETCNQVMESTYGITIEDAGLTSEEFLTHWFDPQVSPEDTVERYAEKYNLTKVNA
ncbi:hypothetical protein JYP52_01200 [Nitratireductor aquibiodomus]|uniref:hypothetical protein n=1 Tax=Nitratireductor aquibiodomus TaxID=204799 RepID=UPI0019D3DB02|nr:hypothetical protein [Nitratireductor aquibiodomus]MBN7759738.1 hypothetical protein [Nitratireductor aquibiodomus]